MIFTAGYALAFLIFFGFEGWAIFNKTKGDTFSEHVRAYFHTKGKVGSFAFLILFGTFAAWFAAHIVGAAFS
jgi:hypothetical protein